MRINSLQFQSLIYLSLPLFLFSVGFLRWYVAIIMVGAILYSTYSVYTLHSLKDTNWKLNRCQVVGAISVALFCCFFLGVSGYWSQSYDWVVKNPLLNELTYSPWPLVIDNSKASIQVKDICGEDRVGLVYYLFFYLPAAVVGKISGSIALARFALFLWSFYGVVLLLCWLLHFVSQTPLNRSQTILVFVCFIAWGGVDIIGQCLRVIVLWILGITPIRPTSWLDEWCLPYFTYYASHFTSLYWCFNQSIPLWLEMFLIISFRNIRTVGYFYCFSLLYSPWAAIGLLPIVGIMVFDYLKKNGWKTIRQMYSFSNIIFPMLVVFLTGTYYMSNSTPLVEKGFFWNFISIKFFIVKYVVFILLEIGAYVWLMRREIKADVMLSMSICLLLLIPFYKMTYDNDFIMRVSMPALFVLFAFWVKWCISHFEVSRRVILALLFFSSFTAFQYVYNTTADTIINHGPLVYKENVFISACDDEIVAHFFEDQFFAHDYEKTFFWKYLAK